MSAMLRAASVSALRLDCRADRMVTARRVERALRAAPGAVLEAALESGSGRPIDAAGKVEHLCIRRLRVALPIRVSPATADEGIRQAWGSAAGAALRDLLAPGALRPVTPGVLASPDGDVVVYLRQLDAVADLVAGLSDPRSPPAPADGRQEPPRSRGDVRRAWAWRQCGLLGGPTPTGAADKADVICTVLTAHPHLVPAVLARVGALSPMTARHWARVAIAWVGGGATATGLDLRRGDGAAGARTAPGVPTGPVAPALAAVRRSSLGRAVEAGAPGLPAAERVALARLALTCSAPHLSRDAAAVAAVTRSWRQVPQDVLPAPGSPLSTATADARPPEPHREPGLPHPPGTRRAVQRSSAEPPESAAAPGPGLAEPPDPAAGPGGDPPVAQFTRFGGLLFLAPAIGDVLAPRVPAEELPDAVARLCLRLTGAGRGDPAVLALSGADPRDDPGAAPEHPDDKDAESRVLAWVAWRLDADPEEDLGWIWRRGAAVEISPGWIEAEFSLDDVDLRIRRGLLDIDPGWLWWRGTVMRFRYA